MRNRYRIIDYCDLGLPCIEVYGDQFHYQDLYEIVGCNHHMTTFQVKVDSDSYSEFGPTILGVIYYDHKGLKALENSLASETEIVKPRIRIDSPDKTLSLQQKGDLKYRGLKVADIEHISYLPYKKEPEKYETGEKKVPDIIKIEVDCSGMDVDKLNQNYLVSKSNSGIELIQYEKEQLIGITLAFNNGHIDSRILKHFGFKEHELKENLNIWNSFYKVKERRGQLSELDENNYREVKSIVSTEKMVKAIRELTLSGLNNYEEGSVKILLKKIFESIEDFSPSILLHGDKQVYWDVDSYIHIALRHIKNYQMGNYKDKTPFPYKVDDLKSLIEKVLDRVEDELKLHLSKDPNSDFTRHGKMGIFYNGDHYNLRVNAKGRLTQFHVVENNI